MEWDQLFADLESQFLAQLRQEALGESVDLWEGEVGRLSLLSRLVGSISRPLQVDTLSGAVWRGHLQDVGANWLRLAGPDGPVVVLLPAVVTVSGLTGATKTQLPVLANLTVNPVLRSLARSFAEVVIVTASGRLTGVIAQVGLDHFDLLSPGRTKPVSVVLAQVEAILPQP